MRWFGFAEINQAQCLEMREIENPLALRAAQPFPANTHLLWPSRAALACQTRQTAATDRIQITQQSTLAGLVQQELSVATQSYMHIEV